MYPLFRAAQRGDGPALERFCVLARTQIIRTVRFRTAGGWLGAWTEDIVQDSLLDVIRYLPGCKAGCQLALAGWLRRVATRRVFRTLRREHRHPPADEALVASIPTADFVSEEPSSLEAVMLCGRLTNRQHALLYDRLVEGMTWREVALEYRTSPSGAKRRY